MGDTMHVHGTIRTSVIIVGKTHAEGVQPPGGQWKQGAGMLCTGDENYLCLTWRVEDTGEQTAETMAQWPLRSGAYWGQEEGWAQ